MTDQQQPGTGELGQPNGADAHSEAVPIDQQQPGASEICTRSDCESDRAETGECRCSAGASERCQYGHLHLDGLCVYCERNALSAQVKQLVEILTVVRDRLAGKIVFGKDDTLTSLYEYVNAATPKPPDKDK